MIERRSGNDRREQPFDVVARPKHYNMHKSGYECVDLAELLNGNLFNALKYCWRCTEKNSHLEDVRKALWYTKRHCESKILIPIFASNWLLEAFTRKAAAVIEHEEPGSLLSVALASLAAGEPTRMIPRIEQEIAALEANA